MIDVPAGAPAGFTLTSFPPANSTRVPLSSSVARVSSTSRETAAIVGSASPRKPSVAIDSKSSAPLIFDVACRSKASSESSGFMPQPSSVIRIKRLPPDSVSIRIDRAPASSAFSSNSLTTEAGRSTTSPAAILLATFSGRIRMRLTSALPETEFPVASIPANPGAIAFQLAFPPRQGCEGICEFRKCWRKTRWPSKELRTIAETEEFAPSPEEESPEKLPSPPGLQTGSEGRAGAFPAAGPKRPKVPPPAPRSASQDSKHPPVMKQFARQPRWRCSGYSLCNQSAPSIELTAVPA